MAWLASLPSNSRRRRWVVCKRSKQMSLLAVVFLGVLVVMGPQPALAQGWGHGHGGYGGHYDGYGGHYGGSHHGW